MNVSVVIPCYNEQDSIRTFFPDLARTLAGIPDASFSFVLVNDGSTDGTQSILEEFARGRSDTTAVRLLLNGGHQHALVEGLRRAPSADAFLTLDGDGQHPASVARELVDAWRSADPPADIVQAVRTGGQSKGKNLTGDLFYALARKLVDGLDIQDGESDFRVISPAVRDLLLSSPAGQRNLRIFFGRIRGRRIRIPYEAAARISGTSKYTFRKMAGFSFLPLRLSHAICGTLLLFSLGFLGRSLWAKATGSAVAGWTSTVGLLCLGFAGVFAVLSILSEYVILLFRLLENQHPREASFRRSLPPNPPA